MAINFKVITDDGQYNQEMKTAGGKLVIVDFTSARCPPCQRIAPIFAAMGEKFPGAFFFSVDVQACPGSAQANSIQATPTFMLFRNKIKVDSLQGGDAEALESKISKHYTEADKSDKPMTTVDGHIDLLAMINKKGCECLNQSDDHPYSNALFSSDETFLESEDDDPELLLTVDFTQLVKIHSLKIMGPADCGPKKIKIFTNQAFALDFSSAHSNVPTQEIQLSAKQLRGDSLVKVNFLKFQNIQNVTLFVQSNHGGEEVSTKLSYLQFNGSPMVTTNMSDFKRISGKAGESH